MGKRVFISYTVEDRKMADTVCAALETRGIACWIAPRDVAPGKDYAEEILHGIETTELMVVLLSEKANASTFVKNEVERAFSKRKTVIPFRIQDVNPSRQMELFLSGIQWIDAWNPPLEAKINVLIETIGKMLGIALPASSSTPPPSPPSVSPTVKPVLTRQVTTPSDTPKVSDALGGDRGGWTSLNNQTTCLSRGQM